MTEPLPPTWNFGFPTAHAESRAERRAWLGQVDAAPAGSAVTITL